MCIYCVANFSASSNSNCHFEPFYRGLHNCILEVNFDMFRAMFHKVLFVLSGMTDVVIIGANLMGRLGL